MDWSIHNASTHTHLKIVAIALLAATVVVWGGLAAHMSATPHTRATLGSILAR